MRKLLLTTTAIAFAVGAAAPAMAEFNSRNIRVSNGINQTTRSATASRPCRPASTTSRAAS